jgi:hypothetical protein
LYIGLRRGEDQVRQKSISSQLLERRTSSSTSYAGSSSMSGRAE